MVFERGQKNAIYNTDESTYQNHFRKEHRIECQSSCEKRRNLRISWAERRREDERYENADQFLEADDGQHRDFRRNAYAEIL